MTPEFNWFKNICSAVFSPGHFFVRPPLRLVIQKPIEETVTWEVFRGQLLDSRHTRRKETFLSTHVALAASPPPADEPQLTLRLECSCFTLHVTRWLRCRVWEAVDSNGVIDSQEVERWVEELVGTIEMKSMDPSEDIVDLLQELVFHAVVGLSRLPLNSVETPLPAFSLGSVGYFPCLPARADAVTDALQLLNITRNEAGQLPVDSPRRLELFLRSAYEDQLDTGAQCLTRLFAQNANGERELLLLLRGAFNQTSLTPYTNFVDHALALARTLVSTGGLGLFHYASLLFGLIRQTVFHLTAYDLQNFHHLGANYPDALMLERLMIQALELVRNHPELIRDGNPQSRSRRRALLLGWWQYRMLMGLPVPDAPTSPGENRRILPAPHEVVPEEQLTQIGRRTKRLFERGIDFSVYRESLEVSLQELPESELLVELGTALFLDRPFGTSKPLAALDLTPMLSYQLFSRNVVHTRLKRISRLEPDLATRPGWADAERRLDELAVAGIPAPSPMGPSGTVRLQDCWRTSDDFIVLRATPETIRQLRAEFRWDFCKPPLLDWYERKLLPIPMPGPTPGENSRLVFLDQHQRIVAECEVSSEGGFKRRGALELPLPGLMTQQDGQQVIIESCFPEC